MVEQEKMAEQGELVRGTAYDGGVRILAVDATEVVETLRRRQGTDPAVTAALGRAAIGALLLGALLKKDQQSVTLRIDGGGPAGILIATATAAGEVRGIVGDPRPDIVQVRDGKLNVSGAVGSAGRLTVTRDLGMRQPYSSTIEMVSGEIGEDLAHFFVHSEQVPSAVGIGVFVQPDGTVEAAGGYLVQLLPGLPDRVASDLEGVIGNLAHPTELLRGGDTPEDMLRRIVSGDLRIGTRMPVRFHCPCDQDRAGRALALLDAEELEEMRQEATAGETELVCEFCGDSYRFTTQELTRFITAA